MIRCYCGAFRVNRNCLHLAVFNLAAFRLAIYRNLVANTAAHLERNGVGTVTWGSERRSVADNTTLPCRLSTHTHTHARTHTHTHAPSDFQRRSCMAGVPYTRNVRAQQTPKGSPNAKQCELCQPRAVVVEGVVW